MHRCMLAIAQRVLDARAALDGHAPGQYDAEEEGFVASILNALHQWCVAHNVEWHEELDWAQRFFEQDMAEIAQDPGESRILSLDDLGCPRCAHTGSFLIQAGVTYLMHADGTMQDREEPLQWDEHCRCACPECKHKGTVGAFCNTYGKEG